MAVGVGAVVAVAVGLPAGVGEGDPTGVAGFAGTTALRAPVGLQPLHRRATTTTAARLTRLTGDLDGTAALAHRERDEHHDDRARPGEGAQEVAAPGGPRLDSVRPASTAERAIGSERKRSTMHFVRSSARPTPVCVDPKMTVWMKIPGIR